MQKEIKQVLKLSRKKQNTLPTLARNVKAGEEFGEFSQALLHKLGYLPHKNLDESLMGETADLIMCALDTLCSAYAELSEEEVYSELEKQIAKKSIKWEKVMNVRYELVKDSEVES